VYKINDPAPNAFATGRDKDHAAVAFTTGILALLNEEELDGVIAHELTHIANRDILLMTIVGVLASFISLVANYMMFMQPRSNNEEGGSSNAVIAIASTLVIVILLPLAATLVQMAISRKREFLADAGGAIVTGAPSGLASALQKIASYPIGMREVNPSISHMFISNPEKLDTQVETKHSWFATLFMTHPPVEARVRALLGDR
jgi:heat shock protein HtpX